MMKNDRSIIAKWFFVVEKFFNCIAFGQFDVDDNMNILITSIIIAILSILIEIFLIKQKKTHDMVIKFENFYWKKGKNVVSLIFKNHCSFKNDDDVNSIHDEWVLVTDKQKPKQ